MIQPSATIPGGLQDIGGTVQHMDGDMELKKERKK
jgi:hypothetical protein